MRRSPLPAPAVSAAVLGLPTESFGTLAAATAGTDPIPWVAAVATVGLGLVLLAGTSAVMAAARRRSTSDDPARRLARLAERAERPVDPEISATLDRRAIRRAGARSRDETS